MLVLGRKIDQAILIHCPNGEKIRVVLTEIRDLHKVRIGIDAPKEYRVVREEINERYMGGVHK